MEAAIACRSEGRTRYSRHRRVLETVLGPGRSTCWQFTPKQTQKDLNPADKKELSQLVTAIKNEENIR